MSSTVFVPVGRAQALALHDDPTSSLADVAGHAATPALMAAYGYDASSLEDAEFAALGYAGVRAVTVEAQDPLRLVLAAQVEPARLSVGSDELGTVGVAVLRWSDVSAVFADEPGAEDDVAAARAAATGQQPADALDQPAVRRLLDERDLLWYAPQELTQLVDP